MENKINISVQLIVREKVKLFKECLQKIYKHAKYPDKIETLIAVDNDDIKTINFIKTDKIFKEHKNIIVLLFPRMGYKYLGLYHKELYSLSKGDIIVPIGVHSHICLENWDENFLKYKDESVIMGWWSRMVMTRKCIEEYDFVKDFFTKPHKTKPSHKWVKGGDWLADDLLRREAIREGIYIGTAKWHGRYVHVQKDVTDRWELKDLSVLDNLKVERLEL